MLQTLQSQLGRRLAEDAVGSDPKGADTRGADPAGEAPYSQHLACKKLSNLAMRISLRYDILLQNQLFLV